MKQIIETYLRYLKIERNASKHTLEAYRRDLSQLHDFLESQFGDLVGELGSVNRLHLRAWLSDQSKQNLKRSTLQRKIASLRSFFKFAYRRGYVDQNIAVHLISPKSEQRLPKVIAQRDIQRTLDSEELDVDHNAEAETPLVRGREARSDANQTAWLHQTKAILEMLYATGIRLSELTGANISDIDLKSMQIRVTGKGAKQRIVPFGKAAGDALKLHVSTRGQLVKSDSESGEAIFLSKTGKRLYPRAVQRIVKDYLSRYTEARQQSPHAIRHSFATHLLDNGADIRVIKELLGHSSLNATQIYTSTSSQKLKEVHKRAHPRAET